MKTEKLLVRNSTGQQRNWASLKDRSGQTDILQQRRCDTNGNCPGKPPWHAWVKKEFETVQKIEKKNNKNEDRGMVPGSKNMGNSFFSVCGVGKETAAL